IDFEETVGGQRHRYPELLNVERGLVAGKVIFTCDRPPDTHNAEAWLERRQLGAGARWAVVDSRQSSWVPRPKEAIFLRGHCDFGQTHYWRVRVEVKGTITQADGKKEPFEVADTSRESLIVCREKR